MNIQNLLKKRNTIYGICSVWIVLFHVFRKISMPYIPILTNIVGLGNLAVDIFFFYSGLCLYLAAKRNQYQETGWKKYFFRRISRILVPYLLIAVPYYLWSSIYEIDGSALHKTLAFFVSVSSGTFWILGTQTTWYVYGIAVFYILFPLMYSFIEKKTLNWQIGLVGCLILLAVATNYIPVIRNSMIVWARLPIFTIGIIFGRQKETMEKLRLPRWVALIAGAILILLGWLISQSELSDTFNLPQVYRLLLYIPVVLALMLLLSRTGRSFRPAEIIGEMSLEMYLIHITLLHPIQYYGYMERLGNWLYLLLPIVTTGISLVIHQIEKWIWKKTKL